MTRKVTTVTISGDEEQVECTLLIRSSVLYECIVLANILNAAVTGYTEYFNNIFT